MTSKDQSPASKLRLNDVVRVGASGPRARKTRTALSALGISIGIAALVGVLGLSESSKSALLDEISALGTNLLTLEAGGGIGAGDGQLPDDVAHGRRQVERDGVPVLRAPDLREARVRRGERQLEQALDLISRVGPQRSSPVAVDERPQRRVAPLRELARAVLGELARRLRPRRDWWW